MSYKSKNWILLAILISVSATTIYNYFFLVDKPGNLPRIEQHNLIIHGTAGSPFRYRILVPFIAEAGIKICSVVLPYPKAFLIVYVLLETIFILFLLGTLFIYCRFWFTWDQSLIGVLFVSSTLVMPLRDHQFQPWSLLEPGLFTLGLIFIYQKKYIPFTLLLFLAALNRETSVFLPLVFLCTELDFSKTNSKKVIISKKSIMLFLRWIFLWVLTYMGVRFIRGDAPQVLSLKELWVLNTLFHSLGRTVIEGSMFIGFFWLFAIAGYRYANEFVKKTVWVVPFYLITIILWGSWHEVRLLMPLYAVLIPLGLSFIYQNDTPSSERQ